MSLPGPGNSAPVLAAVKAMPCGQPAAGLDSGCGPASDNQRAGTALKERLTTQQDQQAGKTESLPNPGWSTACLQRISARQAADRDRTQPHARRGKPAA